MYFATLASKENYLTVYGVATALAPIAHGEPPKLETAEKDNNRPVRKMTISVNGSFVDVPVVSSIHITHLMRALFVRDALRRAGITDDDLNKLRDEQPEFYQALFSGGTLDRKAKKGEGAGGEEAEEEAAAKGGRKKKGNGGSAEKEARKAELRALMPDPESFADLFLAVRLFGGAVTWLDDAMIPSMVGVGHMWAATAEYAAVRGLTAHSLKKLYKIEGQLPSAALLNRVEPAVFVRTDDTVKGKKTGNEPDARMIYRVEYVPAGTRFLHELYVQLGDDDEVRLVLSALRYLQDVLLPGHSFVGGLIKRGFGLVRFEYSLPEAWGGVQVDQALYEEYAEARESRVREAASKLLKAA